MKLSENFELSEFTKSDTATRKRIANNPTPEAVKAIENLVINLLQPLRRIYGKRMVINSGYRCLELNKAVGGVLTSQHTKGEAADVACEHPAYLVECLRKSGLDFDQCIQYSTFVHLSLKLSGQNRKQYLKGRY
ncbi:D-Ala-D-Ala carboxypeptidase family metallohydrolase [Parabacteroides provencensis]|uniref:D-Ala-D-Ala carboxypeptidase family metallohydrolase n=1 Tax=Parabacteroides provencensis TaxID=1944636 RepID=UPI000C145E1B|nr:D-Ala-D-Ala carboxypeptidase family metallohydrolase [Parabacteroides provencensis]